MKAQFPDQQKPLDDADFLEFLVWTSPWRPYLQDALFAIWALSCFVAGGLPERLCALAWGVIIKVLFDYHGFAGSFSVFVDSANWVFTEDATFFAALLVIALLANRVYVLIAAGFQSIAVLTHIVSFVGPGLTPLALAILTVGASWFALLTMIAGYLVYLHRRRSNLYYPDWRWQVGLPRDPSAPRLDPVRPG